MNKELIGKIMLIILWIILIKIIITGFAGILFLAEVREGIKAETKELEDKEYQEYLEYKEDEERRENTERNIKSAVEKYYREIYK